MRRSRTWVIAAIVVLVAVAMTVAAWRERPGGSARARRTRSSSVQPWISRGSCGRSTAPPCSRPDSGGADQSQGWVNGQEDADQCQCDTQLVESAGLRRRRARGGCSTKGAVALLVTCDVEFARTRNPGSDQPRSASRSDRASAPISRARSGSAPRAGSHSASATSPRTRARRWRSTPTSEAWRRAITVTDKPAGLFPGRDARIQDALPGTRRQDRAGRELHESGGAPNQVPASSTGSGTQGRPGDRHVDHVRRLARDHRRLTEPRRQRR